MTGHWPRLEFTTANDGTPAVHPACTCGWVSSVVLDRNDPRGVEPALEIWSQAHGGWAQIVPLPASMQAEGRYAAIVTCARRDPTDPAGTTPAATEGEK